MGFGAESPRIGPGIASGMATPDEQIGLRSPKAQNYFKNAIKLLHLHSNELHGTCGHTFRYLQNKQTLVVSP